MDLVRIWPAALLAACAYTGHTVEPYASDPARATQLQDQARALCEESGREAPEMPFITDGCSIWPDREWTQCCVAHDAHYWCGGSASERKRADQELRTCLEKVAPSGLATLTYWGVRVGAHPIFPLHYRWGFGRRYLPWYDRPESLGAAPAPLTPHSHQREVDGGGHADANEVSESDAREYD